MQFSQLYGVELDRELGSADNTVLFTVARRKAAINAAQLEFVKRTECLTRQAVVTLVTNTQEYDLEAVTGFEDYGWIATDGVSIKIVVGTTTRYLEGDDLAVTTVPTLNVEEPNWRAVSASTPRKIYIRRDGGRLFLGLHPKPAIASSSDTWTALVTYVMVPADLSADSDEPLTFAGNPIKSLRFFHRALVYYAAYDLEKFRKDTERGLLNLKLFEAELDAYAGKQKPKGGQRVRMATAYRGRRTTGRLDPRIFP